MAGDQRIFWEVLTILHLLISLSTAKVHPTKTVITKDHTRNADFTTTYNEIIKDLREHWQSPIMYLKKRGYLPDLKIIFEPRTKLRSDAGDLSKHFISNSKNKINLISSIIDQNEKFETVDDLAHGQLLTDIRDKFASLHLAAAGTNEKTKASNGDVNSVDSYTLNQLNNQLSENAEQIATYAFHQDLEKCN